MQHTYRDFCFNIETDDCLRFNLFIFIFLFYLSNSYLNCLRFYFIFV